MAPSLLRKDPPEHTNDEGSREKESKRRKLESVRKNFLMRLTKATSNGPGENSRKMKLDKMVRSLVNPRGGSDF